MSRNKGEWSEILVFLRALAERVLAICDENLECVPGKLIQVVAALKPTNGGYMYYELSAREVVVRDNSRVVLSRCSLSVIRQGVVAIESAFNDNNNTGAFEIPAAEVAVKKLQLGFGSGSGRGNKVDIELVVANPSYDASVIMSFSIKSFIGASPTLMNASKATRIEYRVSPNMTTAQVQAANIEAVDMSIGAFLRELSNEHELTFEKYTDSRFRRNLLLIDTGFPEYYAYLVRKYFESGHAYLEDLVVQSAIDDPLELCQVDNQRLYAYKVKHFVSEVALGMTPTASWEGGQIVTGGFIIVKSNGEIAALLPENRDSLWSYLIGNLKFDTPGRAKHDYGYLYNRDDSTFIALNGQIRFT